MPNKECIFVIEGDKVLTDVDSFEEFAQNVGTVQHERATFIEPRNDKWVVCLSCSKYIPGGLRGRVIGEYKTYKEAHKVEREYLNKYIFRKGK